MSGPRSAAEVAGRIGAGGEELVLGITVDQLPDGELPLKVWLVQCRDAGGIAGFESRAVMQTPGKEGANTWPGGDLAGPCLLRCPTRRWGGAHV